LFAVKGDGTVIKKHVARIIEAIEAGECKRGIGWDLYKSMYGQPWMPERPTPDDMKHVIPIWDITDDIDRKADYKRLKRLVAERNL
jgi:hypothetical protein